MDPKGTVVAVVEIAVMLAPSSAVQDAARMLDTDTLKLSATCACTKKPDWIETSIFPDPPNVPPTETVYVPAEDGFVIQCTPCCPTVAFDPILMVICVPVATCTAVSVGGMKVRVWSGNEFRRNVAMVIAHPPETSRVEVAA